MDKVILSSENVAKPFGIFSQGVKVGNLVFVSGQISKNTKGEVVGKGDIRAQTRQCIENLKQVLEAGGATLENVVKVTVYVTDMENLKAIHEVRAQYFKEKYPASTLVEVSRLTTQECMIEIEAIAIM
jgi:2-iminobutanoate/2-iminopropanoate deaminase